MEDQVHNAVGIHIHGREEQIEDDMGPKKNKMLSCSLSISASHVPLRVPQRGQKTTVI